MAKAKTINLLLNDGSLQGVISMEASSWNKGELYSSPRKSVNDLIFSEACSRYGVYLLLSEDMVYVGQASDLSRRIKQHIMGKSWWERVVILTTSDDTLNRSDIDYIEASLIARANEIGRLDCDNKSMGNKQKVSKFREVELEQYLEEALFLLELIGVNVFCETTKNAGVSQSKPKTKLISTVKNSTQGQIAIREKKEAIQFIAENGIALGKNINYAKRQDKKAEYWINPNVKVLDKDWDLILNNQIDGEIILLHIPANTFRMREEGMIGLVPRNDVPVKIDLEINSDTLVDRRSRLGFGPYVVKRIKY